MYMSRGTVSAWPLEHLLSHICASGTCAWLLAGKIGARPLLQEKGVAQ